MLMWKFSTPMHVPHLSVPLFLGKFIEDMRCDLIRLAGYMRLSIEHLHLYFFSATGKVAHEGTKFYKRLAISFYKIEYTWGAVCCSDLLSLSINCIHAFCNEMFWTILDRITNGLGPASLRINCLLLCNFSCNCYNTNNNAQGWTPRLFLHTAETEKWRKYIPCCSPG